MHSLRISSSLTVLLAAAVNAALPSRSHGDHYALILSRQAPGTPRFECHSNCGNALAGGRNSAHCDNATWTGYYEACLECALAFDIWTIYGNSVGAAAEACGLSATPSPSPSPSTPTTAGDSTGAGPAPTETSDGAGQPGPATTEPPSAGSETGGADPSSTGPGIPTAGAPGRGIHDHASLALLGVGTLVSLAASLF